MVAAPFDKRLGLGFLSSEVAALRCTPDALHATLVSSWVSVLTYRRPAMAIMNELFHVIPADELRTAQAKLRPLGKEAVEELQILSALSPILASNVAVPFLPQVFATDASLAHGGIASTTVPQLVAKVLWRAADQNGANVLLLPSAAAALHVYDEEFDQLAAVARIRETCFDPVSVTMSQPRPLGLHFQFLEICGGAGKVTQMLVSFGVVCGPVFDCFFLAR